MIARAIARRIGIAVALVPAGASRGLGQPAKNSPAAAANVLRNDSDPTRPILFSLRPEIYSPNRDVTQTALIFRYDRAQLGQRRWLPGKRGVITRFEMPLASTAVSGGATQVGLGDAYAQLLVSPYFTRTFAFVVGSGLRVPTATDPLLGTGGRFSTWVKPEVTWVSNQDNQWNLKFGLVWFR
jgi:hypothetical protein